MSIVTPDGQKVATKITIEHHYEPGPNIAQIVTTITADDKTIIAVKGGQSKFEHLAGMFARELLRAAHERDDIDFLKAIYPVIPETSCKLARDLMCEMSFYKNEPNGVVWDTRLDRAENEVADNVKT